MTPSTTILIQYLDRAMEYAVYEEFDDGTFGATIPPCLGVIAFGDTASKCEIELRSSLEDWTIAGLELGHPLPTICGIDLTAGTRLEPVDAT